MDYLKGKKTYISGPIENGSEENWRDAPKKILIEEFGIDVFDPFADPKQQWVPTLNKADEEEDYETIVSIAKSFVRKDLAIVDRADFVIAYLPFKVPTTGTVHEIINSNNAKKPTLLVTNQKKIAKIPKWYFGFINIKFMFAGWDNMFSYLREVNDGKHMDNNRWDYVYGKI